MRRIIHRKGEGEEDKLEEEKEEAENKKVKKNGRRDIKQNWQFPL